MNEDWDLDSALKQAKALTLVRHEVARRMPQGALGYAEALISVLQEARELLSRPANDFSWSSWKDAGAALAELDEHIGVVRLGAVPPDLESLFAPTGPIQEVSLSSGWGKEFLGLAERFDVAFAAFYLAVNDVAAIERLIKLRKFRDAYNAILAGLTVEPGRQDLIDMSRRLSAALRSRCMDLASNKATDGSPEAHEFEGLLRLVVRLNGEGAYG